MLDLIPSNMQIANETSFSYLSFSLFSAHYILNTFVLHTLLSCMSSLCGYSPWYAAAFNVSPVLCSEKKETRPSEQTCHIEHVMKGNRKCAASRRDTPVPLWSSRGSREVRSDTPPPLARPAIWRNAEKQWVRSSLPASLSPSAKQRNTHKLVAQTVSGH